MLRITSLKLPLHVPPEQLPATAAERLGVERGAVLSCRPLRCSLDARKKQEIHFLYTLEVELPPGEETRVLARDIPGVERAEIAPAPAIRLGEEAPLPAPIVVIGMGPAGLFAACELARHGYRPILIERGRPVEERARDVETFWSGGGLNPESNVMFGEGGAGTFSDGKLTSRGKDPFSGFVLDTLARFGAPESIAVLSKPHVGTDRLRRVVANMRDAILEAGGEIRFSTTLTGLKIQNERLVSVELESNGQVFTQPCAGCVLAIGQAARDTYAMLHQSGLALAPKPFAVGLRVEHPQHLIDQAQYGAFAGHPRLGAAEYHLAAKSGGRGVYTFCMCPGGQVVASSSGPGEVVTNGMSDYARDKPNANAAVVVAVGPEDFGREPFSGLEFQASLERAAFLAGGGDYCAPAQRLEDFFKRRATSSFGGVQPTYRPGVRGENLWDILPEWLLTGLEDGLHAFARQLRGFDQPDAVLTAVESRTSAPVRILRDESGEAVNAKGLYPVGEGAGYAGGIVSAAVDGLRAARRLMEQYRP